MAKRPTNLTSTKGAKSQAEQNPADTYRRGFGFVEMPERSDMVVANPMGAIFPLKGIESAHPLKPIEILVVDSATAKELGDLNAGLEELTKNLERMAKTAIEIVPQLRRIREGVAGWP